MIVNSHSKEIRRDMIQIDVLLSEDQIAQEFMTALARHELSEKFFYWFPLSVRAWLDLCSDGAYRNFVRSHSVLQTHASDLVSMMPSGPIDVISFGAGQGTKDLLLLEQLRQQGQTPRYRPVDASQALLELACQAAQGQQIDCRGLKADLSNSTHLTALQANQGDPPRLIMMLGNTLGAFDPLTFPHRLAAMLRPQDFLLLDGELFSPTETLTGYDNPINRQFAFGPLRSVGLSEPRDGTLHFATDRDDRQPGLYRIRKHFQAARDLAIMLAGETVRLSAGAHIEMNWSYKYEQEALVGLVTTAGLQPVVQYASVDKRFLTLLVTRSP
jgi:uncharacterized SAM-dependent methyltransferase